VDPMDELKKWCLARQADLRRQLELLEAGTMRTWTNHVDTTQQTTEHVRADLAGLDEVLVIMAKE
jgi:hypothetical protein